MATTPSTPDQVDEAFAQELYKPLPTGRISFSYGMSLFAFAFTGLALLPLLAILGEILRRGLPRINWQVLTSVPVDGGFGHAIAGTLIMVGLASLVSIPVGVMTGIFLSEFGQGVIARFVRFVTTILSGVPSIVVGVFAFGVVVLTSTRRFGFSFSALAGGFALAVIMLPIVVLTTEEALKLVPTSQRLASAALGASRLQTTFRIVVAAALPGITTGTLLAVARAAGETAPLVFTALTTDNWPEGLLSPTPSLSVLIFNYGFIFPSPEQNQLAWSASVVLVGLVLLTSILSRIVTRKRLKTR